MKKRVIRSLFVGDLDLLEGDAQYSLIQLLAERGNRLAALERVEAYL